MEVISYKKQKDGSAILTLDLTLEEESYLLSFAVNTILREKIKEEKNELARRKRKQR